MFKVTIFLVTLSLLQLSMCSAVKDFQSENLQPSRAQVLVELNAKVLQLQLEISSTSVDVGTFITDSIREVNSNVDFIRNYLNDKLKDLDELVINATLAAKEAKKSIDACVEAEVKDREKINLSNILKCETPLSLNQLRLKFNEFSSNLTFKTYAIIPKCIVLQPIDNDKLEECGMISIDGHRKNMNDMKDKIQSDAERIVDKDEDCIENNLVEQNRMIKAISKTFSLCVDSA